MIHRAFLLTTNGFFLGRMSFLKLCFLSNEIPAKINEFCPFCWHESNKLACCFSWGKIRPARDVTHHNSMIAAQLDLSQMTHSTILLVFLSHKILKQSHPLWTNSVRAFHSTKTSPTFETAENREWRKVQGRTSANVAGTEHWESRNWNPVTEEAWTVELRNL